MKTPCWSCWYNCQVRRKFIAILILLIVLAVAYLAFIYARFYNTIGEINLQSPYQQRQFALENSQKEGAIKYVALGDSLTAGVGSDDVKSTFVYQVALNFSSQFGKVEVVNLGTSGATSENLISDQLPQVVQENPQYITLLIGINDIHNKVSVADYKSRLVYIVNQLLTKTDARIILINLPYLGAPDATPLPFSTVLDARTRQFNKIIAEVGQGDRIKLIDLYTPTHQAFTESSRYYASDRFHPSSEGYLLWGKIINAN